MKAPPAPRIDERRKAQFLAELQERARAWIPGWAFADVEGDFGHALLEIAARFDSEVSERLDGAGEKMRRGFLDWLAIRGEAARPARMPVVFKMADAATQAVLASAPVRLQADAGGSPVIFETEKDVRVVPGRLDVVVGVDAAQDAFYLPPPGLSDLEPLEQDPTQWQLKSFAAAKVTKLQLDPEAGLAVDMIIEAGGGQYRITGVDNGMVTIEPPLDGALQKETVVRKVTTFAPFDGITRNRQEHALYIGHMDLLNIDAEATIDVLGAASLQSGIKWQYWGKTTDSGDAGWQSLDPLRPDSAKPNAVLLLKPKGAIEPKKIGEINSRWIRAYAMKVDGPDPLLQVDALQIRINCAKSFPTCPDDGAVVFQSPAAEGMTNTTPLVLENTFFPLGTAPRQFDAFYLGSQEAFSKKKAEVQLCFKMAEPSFRVLSYLRAGVQLKEFVAGLAADSYLHLLQFDPNQPSLTPFPNREPLQPPSPGPAGVPVDGPPVTLDAEPTFPLPMWRDGINNCVAVTAGKAVWIWKEDTVNQANSGWESAGEIDVGRLTNAAAGIDALVHLEAIGPGQLFALIDYTLFVRDLNDPNAVWEIVETKTPGNQLVQLKTIAPILIEAKDLGGGNLNTGLVGVDKNHKLFGLILRGTLSAATCKELRDKVAWTIAPAAVRSSRFSGNDIVVVAIDQPNKQILSCLTDSNFENVHEVTADLNAIGVTGNSIDVNLSAERLTFVTVLKITADSSALAAWSPFDPDSDTVPLFTTKIPGSVGKPIGAPTLLPHHVIVPTTSSQVIVAPFDARGRKELKTLLITALVTSRTTDQLVPEDQVAIAVQTHIPTHKLQEAGAGIVHGGETLYQFNFKSIDDEVFVYRKSATGFTGKVDPNALDELTIDAGDDVTKGGSILLITTDDPPARLYYVKKVEGKKATLDRRLEVKDPDHPPQNVIYNVPESTTAKRLPLMDIDPANGNWDAALLDRTSLIFPDADPEFQNGTAFKSSGYMGLSKVVVLRKQWVTPPPEDNDGKVTFIVDASVGDWIPQLGNKFTNPELSWEYWNGKGWWILPISFDNTQDLKSTGALRFTVPDDIASSDWAGKTNFWIRARLIGGDYGHEKVTIKTTTPADGVTQQTIDRSTEGIHPPSVLKLEIFYQVSKPVLPTYVLAQDSGSILDQSDANSTGGAIVEAFVPLSLMLDRLSGSAIPRATTANPPPQDECQEDGATSLTRRSLFIGLDATVSEAPVNVLLLVDKENGHTAFAPLIIEALVAGRFQPIVADDGTRALGESGVLSMSFAVPPTRSDLFGQTRTWLRLTPKGATGDWLPSLRGAYLNAVFASATETLTRELAGSSDGSPNLTLRLARPPLLRNTLELRVREPLGEEERDALVKLDANLVLSSVEGLDGDWVLWKQVIDPDDEDPAARVYALDEASGQIRFGDGIHGRIPPIGRGAIVAFRYCRTEPGSDTSSIVPGNLVTARTVLNLVSPVESVEAVTAADQSAGGAPPESDERVLRFGFARLRHRGRAVTARDIEDLARESSPDIAQARAIIKRGYVRLIVVMKGKNPTPNAAQVRELRRLLLAEAPLSLSAPRALRIEGPRIRRLRIELELRIETLDYAGQVSQWVKDQLASFFDSAVGGIDKDGWPLSLNPTEEDIAFVLINAPNLEGIENVTRLEHLGNGSEQPWPENVKPDEIVMLDDDPVRIQFETAEVSV